ncbi:WbqC family protein [candidate division KSB1 bacterium]|nr:WbqC family protein [candidate division KSB1 bacterium]
MKLAAHQPIYLPSISYFQKMSQADIFLLADDLQYSTHGNFNRCQIKTFEGPHWLTVPVYSKGRQRQALHQVEIDQHQHWGKNHIRTLDINYQNSPYYELYRDKLASILSKSWSKLTDLNIFLINYLASQLFLKIRFIKFSDFSVKGITNERLITVMKKVGCKTYLVEEKYRPFLNLADFQSAEIAVQFIKARPIHYYQQFNGFVPDLSMIDLLFNEGELGYRFF